VYCQHVPWHAVHETWSCLLPIKSQMN
jgi:hypothetical protein